MDFMPMDAASEPDTDLEKTRPPMAAVRYESLVDLYAAIPQLAELTQARPDAGDNPLTFLTRLRGSTTPEEAVTFTAFAVQPKLAIWWAHECLRLLPDSLSTLDRDMMEKVAQWIGHGETADRHLIMRDALWAPTRSPGVMLGLAVGWSGGSIAPNDPAAVPLHRCPRAINTAVLSSLAKADMNRRGICLARFIDMAESLFRL